MQKGNRRLDEKTKVKNNEVFVLARILQGNCRRKERKWNSNVLMGDVNTLCSKNTARRNNLNDNGLVKGVSLFGIRKFTDSF